MANDLRIEVQNWHEEGSPYPKDGLSDAIYHYSVVHTDHTGETKIHTDYALIYQTIQHGLTICSICPILGLAPTVLKIFLCLITLLTVSLCVPVMKWLDDHGHNEKNHLIASKQILRIAILNMIYCLGNLISAGFLFFNSEVVLPFVLKKKQSTK